MNPIYLDNNATTPVLPAVWEAMRPFALEDFGNPSSAHAPGRRARRALEDARDQVSDLLGAEAQEVVFTSGATEANNLALFGLAGTHPGHLVSSGIEHPSATEPLNHLQHKGFGLTCLDVNSQGEVIVDSLPSPLPPDTRLACIQLANPETGAIQPVSELVRRLSGRVPLHCDAVQAVGKVPLNFRALGAACLSLSAHKFHGPKGVGALLVRKGIRLNPQLLGGPQQRGLRPGTESVPLVVGLAKALEMACSERAQRIARVHQLRNRFWEALRADAPSVVLNGPDQGGIPHTLNVSFPGCRADVLLMNLDLAGIACSTGSACSSGSLLPSPVLRAMRVPEQVLSSAMRFSLSHLLTAEDVDEAARRIAKVVGRLRASPVE